MDSRESGRPVDRLFTRLLVKYGTQWLNQWNGVPMDLVRSDWEWELSGLTWGAINYAFENLPADGPPATAAAFKRLAINRPEYFKGLPSPKADPEIVKDVMSKLKVVPSGGGKSWAHDLRQRERAGECLSPAQRQAWRKAIGSKGES